MRKVSYEYIKDKLDQPTYGFKPDGDPVGKIITQELIDERKVKMEEEELKVPVAVQVKEKFGGLRFYVQAATDTHYKYITFAESMSYRTCEECGAPGKTYTDGWHTTLCDIHAAMAGREQEYESMRMKNDFTYCINVRIVDISGYNACGRQCEIHCYSPQWANYTNEHTKW
jgi:hypothetical protein